jgi:hypothetical protein
MFFSSMPGNSAVISQALSVSVISTAGTAVRLGGDQVRLWTARPPWQCLSPRLRGQNAGGPRDAHERRAGRDIRARETRKVSATPSGSARRASRARRLPSVRAPRGSSCLPCSTSGRTLLKEIR